MRKYFYMAMLLHACMVLCANVYANAPPTKAQIETQLITLKQQIEHNPGNLDNYFAYAQIAAAYGKLEEAKDAYLHMLAVEPGLHRVKLDLGMVYLRMGDEKAAKRLFDEVLATNPPESVANNIKRVIAQAKQTYGRTRINAAVSLGYNYDTNANSAAGTGYITFNDISIPLADDSRKQKDGQVFAAASLQHHYWFRNKSGDTNASVNKYWHSSATMYRADQERLKEQNIQAFIFQTGPAFEVKKLKTIFNLTGGYQHVDLDGRSYLDITSAEASAAYNYSQALSLTSSLVFEDRNFINSPRVSTYKDRSGSAYQTKFGLNYKAGKNDFYSASIGYRKEETKQAYYDNSQWILEGSYTHVFPYDIFASLALDYRESRYGGPDPLISLATIREDEDAIAGITLGKRWKHNITYVLGYQFRRVDSNQQNYDYSSHRVSVGLNWSY